jgi:GNAT superfamily N-acetyltransferase
MNYGIVIGKGGIQKMQRTLGSEIWPEFLQHDEKVNRCWPNLYAGFLKYQFALTNGDGIIAVGNTVPLLWRRPFAELPDTGLDWALAKANTDFKRGSMPNVLIGIQVLVNEKYQGRGISFEMLKIMKGIAKTNGIDHIALPVRPTLKCNYPLIPIAEYLKWQNKDGLPFDPWLRVHVKIGGEITGICRRSMDIVGSVSAWQDWTGLAFPGSGAYIVDKALVPVRIDKKRNIGRYVEPNVWVMHKI